LQQIRVLAEEPNARASRHGSLQEGGRVNKASSVDLAPGDYLDSPSELLEARFYDVVVVEPPGVPGDAAKATLVYECRGVGVVINSQRNQRPRVRSQPAWASVKLGFAGHVIHTRGEIGQSPLLKGDVVAFERLNGGDARDFEADLPRSAFDLCNKLAHEGKAIYRVSRVSIS
jgi:hypothetical protein